MILCVVTRRTRLAGRGEFRAGDTEKRAAPAVMVGSVPLGRVSERASLLGNKRFQGRRQRFKGGKGIDGLPRPVSAALVIGHTAEIHLEALRANRRPGLWPPGLCKRDLAIRGD